MAEPLKFFDRRTRTIKMERIYGERWLRFGYENPLGGLLIWAVARRAIFSKWYGRRMNKPVSALKILPFIAAYDVDVDDFARSPFDFKTFNEFFYRALKPEARPIARGEDVAVLPADGRHFVFPDVAQSEGFYAKGSKFTLESLLDDAGLAAKFAGGSMVISRLAPPDYHRFHFPVAGTPGEPCEINGWLYSVSPIALRKNLQRLVQNKRMVTVVDSPQFGQVAVLEIGATNVGSIRQSGWEPGKPVRKGEEKGYFAFGGSCVITLFQRRRIVFDSDLVEQSARYLETFARMGERLGTAQPAVA